MILQGQYPVDKCPLKKVRHFTVPFLREHTKELPELQGRENCWLQTSLETPLDPYLLEYRSSVPYEYSFSGHSMYVLEQAAHSGLGQQEGDLILALRNKMNQIITGAWKPQTLTK